MGGGNPPRHGVEAGLGKRNVNHTSANRARNGLSLRIGLLGYLNLLIIFEQEPLASVPGPSLAGNRPEFGPSCKPQVYPITETAGLDPCVW